MLINLVELQNKYSLKIKGVLHIGAFIGEEVPIYRHLGIENIILFEPQKILADYLQQTFRDIQTFQVALGNFNGETELYISQYESSPKGTCGSGASSSILKPKEHLKWHPKIHFPTKEQILIRKLDDLIIDHNIDIKQYNFINIDVQGYELEVFKGAIGTLEHIDYIMTEINNDETYEDCARIEELDSFLLNFGFTRVETNWAGCIWGDAFYIRE